MVAPPVVVLTLGRAKPVNKDFLFDELRRLEKSVVQGERQLAEQEALLIFLTKHNQDLTEVEANLKLLRAKQQDLQQDRSHLLSMLQR